MYSIIIPHKDTADLLIRCVKSIPQRSDIEIIIVDDFSNETEFHKIQDLDKYDRRIKIIRSTKRKGAGAARNIGISLAIGEWLLFADSDDFYENDFLSVIDRILKKDTDVLYFSAKSVDCETLKPARRLPHIKSIFNNYFSDKKNGLDAIKYKLFAPWNKVFNANFVKKYHLSFDETIKGNDITFTILAGYFAENIQVIPNELYTVTYRPNSMTFAKRSIDSYICDICNHLMVNEFFDYIGRNKWKINILKEDILKCLYHRGPVFSLIFIFNIIKQYKKILKHKNHILNNIQEKQNKAQND